MILVWTTIYAAQENSLVEIFVSGSSQPPSPRLGSSLTAYPSVGNSIDIKNFEVLSLEDQSRFYLLLRTKDGYTFPVSTLSKDLSLLIEKARRGEAEAILCGVQNIIDAARLYFSQNVQTNIMGHTGNVHSSVFEAVRAAGLVS